MHLACGGCNEDLIEQLLQLVDNMESAVNFLSESDVVSNSNQFDQLRSKASSIMVRAICCGIYVLCMCIFKMYFIMIICTTNCDCFRER